MILFKKQISAAAASALALASLFSGCFNDNDSETIVTDYSNALITAVTLGANTNVCASLSSYSFTIDHLGNSDPELIEACRSLWQIDDYSLQPGIIFNCDSLPIGSVADSIKVTLTYSSPYKVKFYQYDADMNLLNITNYSDTQTIWFDDYAITRIQVTARDRLTNKSYFLKMNVRQSVTDTIMWKYLAKEMFDMSEVTDQRIDTIGTTLCWYTDMSDGTQQVRTTDLGGDVTQWSDAQTVSAPAAIDLGTLLNWKNTLYAVGGNGNLLSTTDGLTWSVASTDFTFVNLLGVQLAARKNGEYFCAIASVDDSCHFVRSDDGASWTLDTLIVNDDTTSFVPAGFPIHDYTRPISVGADLKSGSTTSRIYITGGLKADSTLTASTWSTDGTQWVEFEQRILRPMRRASIVRYTLDTDEPDSFWIMQTGEMAGGYVSDTLYFSQNSGVTWKKLMREFYRYGDTYHIAPFGCSSGFVDPKTYRIYFIGGKTSDGEQQSNIVTGQLVNLVMRKKI